LDKIKTTKIHHYEKEKETGDKTVDAKMKFKNILKINKWSLTTKIIAVVILVFGLSSITYFFDLKNSIIIAHEGESALALLAESSDQIAQSGLARDGDARVNILILGKGGDSHAGGNLTDTIQVLSLDIFNNTASMLSIPRDFYVDNVYGTSKINAVYANANGQKKDSGGAAMKTLVSDITDLTIHYFLVIDFDGFSTLIDSLGGVNLYVENTIHDEQYPVGDEAGSTETFHLNAGWQTLSGDTALKFVRSRHTPGAEGSDFARSARQQQVLAAIKNKALSIGVLANPVKFLNMLDILGRHLKTDISPNDLKLVLSKSQDIDTENLQTAVLSNGTEGLLTDTHEYGTYALIPNEGFFNYSAIQKLMHSIATDPLILKENAAVRILYNDAYDKDYANEVSDLLTNYGYNVIGTESTDQKASQTTILSYKKDEHLFTLNYLEQRFQVAHQSKRGNNDQVDIDIIVKK